MDDLEAERDAWADMFATEGLATVLIAAFVLGATIWCGVQAVRALQRRDRATAIRWAGGILAAFALGAVVNTLFM
jgi:predicted kinase